MTGPATFIDTFAAAASAAVNARDVDRITALWSEPAEYNSPLTGPQRGLAALRAREEALFAGFGELRATITPFGQNGLTGAMLVRFDGTHDGPYAGFDPSGRPVALEMLAVVTFDDDGRVIAEEVYFDPAEAAAALA